MAIIIPSKNIYDINNNKIIENKIDKVEVNSVSISTIENTDVNIYSNDLLVSQFIDYGVEVSNPEKEKFSWANSQQDIVLDDFAYAYFDNEIKYISTTLTIPKLGINERIDKIEKVELSVYGTKIVQNISASLTINYDYSRVNHTATLGAISYGARNEKEGVFEFPETPESVFVLHIGNVTANVTGVENLSFYHITEDENNFYLYFYQMVSYISKKLTAKGSFDNNSTSHLKQANGTYTYYEPYKLSISVNGNKKTIDIKDINQVYGNPNSQNLFSIESNELMQITNYHNKKVEGTLADRVKVDLLPYNAENTLNKYAKGKETATILCSISDYYDQDGNKVIDITQQGKMMFKEFDVVIPYIYNARGQDVPMSVRKDNTTKEFTIVSIEPFYDGAVWQRLYLLEKTQEKQT